MILDKNNIAELIAKSFTSKLDENENSILENWKAESKSNLDEYNDYKDLWEKAKSLCFPSPINTRQALDEVRKKAGIDSKSIDWINIGKQAVAVIFLSITLSVLYNYFVSTKKTESNQEKIVYQQVKAAYGTQSKIELSDGTVVFLNSGSELSFPNTFTGSDHRQVKIIGEGYFTVAKNAQRPFVVEANKLQIKVLGTSFNVEAYPNNENVTIALVEGKVALQHKVNDQEENIATLIPNQIAFFNNANDKVKTLYNNDLRKYTGWIDGKIVFVDDPIDIVMQKLENWYNVDIEFKERKLEKYRFTGTFIDESIENILKILSLTSDMRYEIIQSEKNDDKTFTRCRIILKSK